MSIIIMFLTQANGQFFSSFFSFAGSPFGIVEPFPENIYPIEFSAAQVTCAAFDSSGEKIPDKIKFMRRDEFNRFEELKATNNLYFTNRTQKHGR
jgi:hypothetical protein